MNIKEKERQGVGGLGKWKMRPSAKSAHTRRKCRAGRGGSVVAPDGDGSKVTMFA